MAYRFVDVQKADGFPVTMACEVAGVSTSAYYDWKAHRDGVVTVAELEEARLVAEITTIHADSDGTYGQPRISNELDKGGFVVNHKRVERLMRVHGIAGYTPPKKQKTTIPASNPVTDLVGGDFAPGAPDQRWAGDITYIPTWEGWLYLAAVQDLGSRRIVGVSMADHMRSELVCDALSEACGLRSGDLAGTIFHSDKGSQYTSGDFTDLCDDHQILRSVGRTGICWDNAVVESFFATLKKELVYRRTFRTRADARLAIRAWIARYNTRRSHSTLGYLTPTEWEDNYYRQHLNTGIKAA